MGELVDYEKETERLSGELKQARDELQRARGKLENANFVAKAPKALVRFSRIASMNSASFGFCATIVTSTLPTA